MKPLLAVALLTRDRSNYLRQFIESLARQDFDEPYELVILDNGSTVSAATELEKVLSLLPSVATVKLLREEQNLLGWTRFRQAADASTAEYILVPGDDDILLPSYLRTMQRLAETQPRPMLISCGAETIDADGKRLGGRLAVPNFPDQPTAMASLISQASYTMPASGFHRTLLSASPAPRTRSSMDWWMWLQCWARGTAAVDHRVAVLYRVHRGQEQHQYGTASKALDGARMLLAFVTSVEFRQVVAGWNEAQFRTFIDVVVEGRGPSWGEPRWSGVIEAVLADTLADYAPSDAVARLFADGSSRAGVIVSPAAMDTFLQTPGRTRLDPSNWMHTSVAWSFVGNCRAISDWREYLASIPSERGEISVALRCDCEGEHSLGQEVTGVVTYEGSSISLQLAAEPNEGSTSQLFHFLGNAISGHSGLAAAPIGVEQLAIKWIRRLKRSYWANRLVGLGRRAGLRIG